MPEPPPPQHKKEEQEPVAQTGNLILEHGPGDVKEKYLFLPKGTSETIMVALVGGF